MLDGVECREIGGVFDDGWTWKCCDGHLEYDTSGYLFKKTGVVERY